MCVFGVYIRESPNGTLARCFVVRDLVLPDAASAVAARRTAALAAVAA